MKRVRPCSTLLLVLFLLPVLALAAKPGDRHALEGVSTGKIARDINPGSAEKLALSLKVIDETCEDLKGQNVAPDRVLNFRGPSARRINTDRTGVPLDEEAHYDVIAAQLKALMAKPDARAEDCSVATHRMGVDAETLLPGIQRVGTTRVSRFGYQARGYAIIPSM